MFVNQIKVSLDNNLIKKLWKKRTAKSMVFHPSIHPANPQIAINDGKRKHTIIPIQPFNPLSLVHYALQLYVTTAKC